MTVPLSVLFVASECAPWVKTGGLGDVAAALPAALVRLDCDVRVLLPCYAGFRELAINAAEATRIPARAQLPEARVLEVVLPSGVRLLLLDAPWFYAREGGPYQDAQGEDWRDNAVRFAALSHAAAWISSHGLSNSWRPQLMHCHDWQAALAPAYAHFDGEAGAASLLTVHNLAFQGLFAAENLAAIGLPASSFTPAGLEFYGRLSFLKGGLQFADALSTVSPTYAREIQSAELGFGLDGLLHARRTVLHGIVNGIDTDEWNPARDPHLSARYDSESLQKKQLNKRALQQRMGLRSEERLPLLAIVSRLTDQKGSDLIAELAPRIIDAPAQIALLGSGEAALEQRWRELSAQYPGRIATKIGFDEALAHLIEAGADIFLMPSRFEPCGLNQMYSQRYGTPPVARATGGLVDTIVDADLKTLARGDASGFLFDEATSDDLWLAIERALQYYQEPEIWCQLQRNGMQRDFSWEASAARYKALYASLCAAHLS